jgi:hypothetical protein
MANTYNPGAESSFTGPTSTQGTWVSKDCRSLLTNLRDNVSRLFDKVAKWMGAEAKRVQKDMERNKAGGMFEKITSGPLAKYNSKTQEAITDAKMRAQNNQSFLDRYTNYLDIGETYVGLTADLVSGVVNTVVDELAVVNQISEAAGLGAVVPSGQNGNCNQNVLVGTVDSLVRVTEKAVSAAARQISTAQTTIGLALQAMPDLYAAIMSMPAGTLSILLTNKKKILERVQGVVVSVVALVRGMAQADYPTDHRALIRWALGELADADGDLALVEQILEAGGKFQKENWNRAEATIDETGDTLLRAESRFPTDKGFVKMLQLLGHQKDLETLISVLDQRQTLCVQFVETIGGFTANFQSANFKNLAGPLVQQIRCVLQVITGDMDRTLDANSLVRYYLKEMQWGAELLQLATMMEGVKGLASDLSVPSTDLAAATDKLSAEVSARSDEFLQAESYSMLNGLLNNFIREMQRKLASNVDPEILAGIGDAIMTEIERLNASGDGLAELLGDFNRSIAAEGVVVAQAAAGLMEIFDGQGLGNFAKALAKGDWKEFLGLNAMKAQLEKHTRELIGDLLQCCRDNAGDGDAAQRLLRMSDTVQDMERVKEHWDKYTGSFPSRFIQRSYSEVLPSFKSMKADTARLSTTRCMNTGEPSTGASSGLTLL